MTEAAIQLWRTPSGRLHSMRRCSGGASLGRTQSVKMTDQELLDLSPELFCRCARSTLEDVRKKLAEHARRFDTPPEPDSLNSFSRQT